MLSTSVLCKQPGRYIGWPTIAQTSEGELLVVFSGDREAHVCPWGKTQMVRSADGGKTWSAPETINNTPLDDRDAGILETDKGTWVVSWFTSLAFDQPSQYSWIPESTRNRWRPHVDKLGPETREKWLGYWIRRSEDRGKTWGDPIPTRVTAPHGPIQLSDKRLIYVGMGEREGQRVIGVETSRDDGRSWDSLASIPIPSNESIAHYHEPHVVETASGRLVAMMRYEPADRTQCFLRQSESDDGGKNWSMSHSTSIWGYPPHLISLKDGRLLVAYGRRIPPFSERVCLSEDEGKTWNVEKAITISEAMNDDLGYPASVELKDGTLLTVYYQIHKKGEKTSLMSTRWRLN